MNSIVGNAFRMAYAAQLQKQPTLQDVIASQLENTQTDKVLWVNINFHHIHTFVSNTEITRYQCVTYFCRTFMYPGYYYITEIIRVGT